MGVLDSLRVEVIFPFIPNILFIVFLFILGVVLKYLIDKSFRRIRKALRERFDVTISKWVIKLVVYSIITLLILVNIPGVNDTILRTLGLIVAAIIAFSSSTIIGNAMSGLMIKIIRSYRAGDVVKIGEHFGQVAEVRLLHTLIVTADKRIVFVPNSTVITGGITNFSEDHPLVKVDVGLGYDLNRIEVEKMLIIAAKSAGLDRVFVSIKNLGDYAATYTINGVLEDVTTLPFVESNVRKNVIDQFHLQQKEILSPQYVSHRPADKLVVPNVTSKTREELRTKETRERKSATLHAKTIYKEAERLIKEGRRPS